MRVLVVGGSGLVGTLIVPYLKREYELCIYDLQPPADASLPHIQADISDYERLAAAMRGMDALVYMAMGSLDWETADGIHSAYDVNVKGLHLALKAAFEAGVSQAVYTSSMSVYADLDARRFPDETVPPDARDLYGFTKRLGEEVCLNAVRCWDMHVNALRLCFPTADDALPQVAADKRLLATAASDVARAISAALHYRGRFQTFMVSGDAERVMLNMSRAELLLGWMPRAGRHSAD